MTKDKRKEATWGTKAYQSRYERMQLEKWRCNLGLEGTAWDMKGCDPRYKGLRPNIQKVAVKDIKGYDLRPKRVMIKM